MKTHKDIKDIVINTPVVTMGTFDGLHIGHLHVLTQLRNKATEINGESVILTFWPHPKIILSEKKIELLNTFEEKISLFEKSGIDHLIILNFTKELSLIGYEKFVREILISKIGMQHLIFGYDHRFGNMGEGTFDKLKPLAKKYHFDLHQLNEIKTSHTISSTKIRQTIKNGDIKAANEMLGYNYKLSGTIVHGKQLGRKIGFPTANIEIACSYKLIPHNGVYACKAAINKKNYLAMMNIGTKPSIKEDVQENIEVHVINFEGNIYGQSISVELIDWLREEQKFSSIEGLQAQLKQDKINTLQLFNVQ